LFTSPERRFIPAAAAESSEEQDGQTEKEAVAEKGEK
jgi:hypothetical protein